MKMNDYIEVNNVELADYVYIVDDYRKCGFTNNKMYPLFKHNGESFAIDDRGGENYGVINTVKIKLYRFVGDSEYAALHKYDVFHEYSKNEFLKTQKRNNIMEKSFIKEE